MASKVAFAQTACALLSALLATAYGVDSETAAPATLYPAAEATLVGYERLTVRAPGGAPRVTRATVESGGTITDILAQTGSPYQQGDRTDIILCVRCIKGKDATVRVDFTDARGHASSITRHYKIAHEPIIRVVAERVNGRIQLDASSSTDPDGGSLKFRWFPNGKPVEGPRFAGGPEAVSGGAILLEVSNASGPLFEIVFFEKRPEEPKASGSVPNHVKCTDLSIFTKNISMLNPEVDLGPIPEEGKKQLEVKADGTLAKSYTVFFGFEVRAKVELDEKVELQEGQDVARTINYQDSDPSKAQNVKRQGRKAPDKVDLDGKEREAPWFEPQKRPDDRDKMVDDDYSIHPTNGQAQKWFNYPDRYLDIKVKGQHVTSGSPPIHRIIWDDQAGPGTLESGKDLSKGITYKAYFRAWMAPDLDKCQKFFTVEIKIEPDGSVTTNKLTVLK